MKKLNFLCSELSGTGGTESVLVRVLNHLANTYDVTLTLSNEPLKKEWLHNLDSKVKIITFKGHNNITKLAFISRIFLTSRDTDFISLSPKMILIGAKIRKIFHKKYKLISWFHFSLTGQDMFDIPSTLPHADGHLAISNTIKRQLTDLDIPKENIKVINNPIDDFDITPSLENSSNNIRLFFAGRPTLGGFKNLREMLTGISKVENAYLDVYGTSDEIVECQDFADSLGLKGRISWHGWTADLWSKIKDRPTALIMTSTSEGLSMIMLESVSHGIPVISSQFDGYENIVKDGINGFSYPLGNVDKLAEVIKKTARANLNPQKVKDSISEFYPEEYFAKLDDALDYFLK